MVVPNEGLNPLVITDGNDKVGVLSLKQKDVSAKTWIVLEEGECCQDHRVLSCKLQGPDPMAGGSGCNVPAFSRALIYVG